MKLIAAIAPILLLSVLLYGCPKQESPLERSRQPGAVQTGTTAENPTTDYGTPPAGYTPPADGGSGDSGGGGGSSEEEDNRSAGNDDDGE